MKFLLNENMPPSLVSVFAELKYEAKHVKDVGLLSKPDEKIFDYAFLNDFIIITHDLDYSRIHALSGKSKPSVILFRIEPLTLEYLSEIIRSNLNDLKEDLLKGVFVVIEENQIRVRILPIKNS